MKVGTARIHSKTAPPSQNTVSIPVKRDFPEFRSGAIATGEWGKGLLLALEIKANVITRTALFKPYQFPAFFSKRSQLFVG